jgi:hypothetical protein
MLVFYTQIATADNIGTPPENDREIADVLTLHLTSREWLAKRRG